MVTGFLIWAAKGFDRAVLPNIGLRPTLPCIVREGGWRGWVVIDLNTVLAGNATALHMLVYAWGINDRGEIAGNAISLEDGQLRAFLLTPITVVPLPGNLMLMLGDLSRMGRSNEGLPAAPHRWVQSNERDNAHFDAITFSVVP
jgi:hypothetical protein